MAESRRIQMHWSEHEQCFLSLVREPGDMEHRFMPDLRVVQDMGSPQHIQVTVTTRDEVVASEADKDWS